MFHPKPVGNHPSCRAEAMFMRPDHKISRDLTEVFDWRQPRSRRFCKPDRMLQMAGDQTLAEK